ncbi:cytokine receptor-like factor 2 [Hemibagrus wyckioides]|uniref:cytokine receptor-like factor 2 n=1 Tax=Hemibagrus wyckioides TaxID=337641 RepID=UPI00266C7931|nr:cytokine receptor-like factor 2 [Hemibagrus wyckioides]
MKRCTCCVLLVLSAVLCAQFSVECASVDIFNMTIKHTSHSINLSWERPDKTKSKWCYRTHVQYRSHCETSWKNNTDISELSFELPAPDMKKNYAFRLRMRLECTQKPWGEWSPIKYWRNDTGPCITEALTFTVKDYLLITILPLVGFMLVYALTHDRVRRLVLPIIPDPKHTQERILNIEQIQWWSNFTQTCEDCKVSEIKVSDREEENTELTLIKCDLDEQPPHTHPTHTFPGKHSFDLATNDSLYSIYSSDTSEDNIDTQCPATRPGYIII